MDGGERQRAWYACIENRVWMNDWMEGRDRQRARMVCMHRRIMSVCQWVWVSWRVMRTVGDDEDAVCPN